MKTIEFRGHEFEYDEKVPKSWKFQRALAKMPEQEQVFFAADAVLLGRADEVAEALGDDIDAMGELLTAITEQVGAPAKN